MPDHTMASNGHTCQCDSQLAVRLTVPLPSVDNAGVPFPKADVRWFEDRLMQIAGGFRTYLHVRGAWDDHGTPYEEPCTVYVTTLPASQLTRVMVLLDTARHTFRQQAIWVEYEAVTGILLTASAVPGHDDREGGDLAVHQPVARSPGERDAPEDDRRCNG